MLVDIGGKEESLALQEACKDLKSAYLEFECGRQTGDLQVHRSRRRSAWHLVFKYIIHAKNTTITAVTALAAIMAMQQNQSAEAQANPSGSTNVLASPLSQQPNNALSSTAIFPSSTPIALATQGSGTLTGVQPAALSYLTNKSLLTELPETQHQQTATTHTGQSSSSNPWVQFFSPIPSDIASMRQAVCGFIAEKPYFSRSTLTRLSSPVT